MDWTHITDLTMKNKADFLRKVLPQDPIDLLKVFLVEPIGPNHLPLEKLSKHPVRYRAIVQRTDLTEDILATIGQAP
jgi:hypothetical protein